jgi:uncharacterized protein (TIGR00730 family)
VHTFDEELLASPPAREGLTEGDRGRADRMRAELAAGFAGLADLGPAVSVFGSARISEGSPLYEQARTIAAALGEAGFSIITGGGPGLMEAANRGARDAGACSVGLGIELPHEEGINRFVDRPLRFHYFFARKVMFVRYAAAFVVLPGGFGTLDELFEALTLRQTEKVRHFPVVLAGSAFWEPLVGWLRNELAAGGFISSRDVELIEVMDDPSEIVAHVRAEHRAQEAEGRG